MKKPGIFGMNAEEQAAAKNTGTRTRKSGNKREKPKILLLQAPTNAGLGPGGLGRGAYGVKILELGIVEGDLGVAGLVVDLHRLDIWGSDLAVRALQLRVPALDLPQPVGLSRLSAPAIRRRRIDLGRDLFCGVLLRLGLPRHLLFLPSLLDEAAMADFSAPAKGQRRSVSTLTLTAVPKILNRGETVCLRRREIGRDDGLARPGPSQKRDKR